MSCPCMAIIAVTLSLFRSAPGPCLLPSECEGCSRSCDRRLTGRSLGAATLRSPAVPATARTELLFLSQRLPGSSLCSGSSGSSFCSILACTGPLIMEAAHMCLVAACFRLVFLPTGSNRQPVQSPVKRGGASVPRAAGPRGLCQGFSFCMTSAFQTLCICENSLFGSVSLEPWRSKRVTF